MPIELVTLTQPNPVYYAALGPFLGNRQIAREVGAAPFQCPGKTWIVALKEGFPVGISAVFLNREESSLPAEFSSAYVVEYVRGQGIYSRMVEKRLSLIQMEERWQGEDKSILVRTANPQVIQCLLHYDFSLGPAEDSFHQLTRPNARFTPRGRP